MAEEKIPTVKEENSALKAIRQFGYNGSSSDRLWVLLGEHVGDEDRKKSVLIKFIDATYHHECHEKDILLMMFGLLQGYHKHLGDDRRKDITEYRKRYIIESDYIRREHKDLLVGGCDEPTDEAIATAVDRLRLKPEDKPLDALSAKVVQLIRIEDTSAYIREIGGEYLDKSTGRVRLREPYYRQKQTLEVPSAQLPPEPDSSKAIVIEDAKPHFNEEINENRKKLEVFEKEEELRKQKDKVRKEATIWMMVAFGILMAGIFIFWLLGII